MSKQLPIRRLKVAPHYKSLHPHLKITASLRLTGDWLLQAGFHPGDVASVEVSEGYLTIRRLS
jgi:hypothetical protein